MIQPCRVSFLALAWVSLVLPAGCEGAIEEGLDGTGIVAIVGATVFTSPGVDPLDNAVVVILDGVVEAVGPRGMVPVPPAAAVLDATGLSVLAGFWNGHVRVEPDLLDLAGSGSGEELQRLLQERFTRYGFTTVVETATPRDALAPLIDRIESGEALGPRILAVGGMIPSGVHLPAPGEVSWPPELLARLLDEGSTLVPALGLALEADALAATGQVPAATPVAEEHLDLVLERISGFVGAGGRLLFGTGAGYVPRYDPIAEHLLLEDVGIPFARRLAALTTEPAARMGYFYLGEVEPGMVADLVLVEGDPEVDVTAFGRVRIVFREGRPIFW